MKTLFGTTGYGMELVYSRVGDSGITETSTLSMVSAFCLPFIYYLHQYSLFNNKTITTIGLAKREQSSCKTFHNPTIKNH